jgi:hypothetical protein
MVEEELTFYDNNQTTFCKSGLLILTDTEARKRGEQTGLDTLVVHAVNDGCSQYKKVNRSKRSYVLCENTRCISVIR